MYEPENLLVLGWDIIFRKASVFIVVLESWKEINLFDPYQTLRYIELLVLSICDYIRKMLNKNHLGIEFPNKAANCIVELL